MEEKAGVQGGGGELMCSMQVQPIISQLSSFQTELGAILKFSPGYRSTERLSLRYGSAEQAALESHF